MVLSATAPTSHFAPLIYIQSRSEKLTAILKKRGEKVKIIFDSQEEKDTFVASIVSITCPNRVGIKKKCDARGLYSVRACRECWKKAVEMEVKSGT